MRDLDASDPRIAVVERLTAAFGAEVAARDPGESVAWPTMPTVAALVAHVGIVHRWVVEILRTRRAAEEPAPPALEWSGLQDWFERGRQDLLRALAASPADAGCWAIGNRRGTTATWRRRMVFENAKHLMDLRAAGGGSWRPAPELSTADYADGIDELFGEFLWRSRPTLSPLPGGVVLRATDVGRAWRISTDWVIDSRDAEVPAAEIRAHTADLALMLWERADPFEDGDRFVIVGDSAVAAALRDAPIHPW